MSVFGVDYAWGRPGVEPLRKAGARFICRYLSRDTTGKNLTRSEAAAFSQAGIWIVVVWEQTAARALDGRAAGAADAREAARQAAECGMPEDRPIYFAVDWDASASQQDEIHAYLDGAASVLGRSRLGLYAGYGPVKRAFDAGKIAYGWQTYAWSGGRWDSRAQLQQYSNDERINGVGLDYDRAMNADYGQWRIGVSPLEEDDMQVTDNVPVGKTFGPKLAHDSYPASYLWTGSFVQTAETLAGVTQILARQEAMQATIDKLVDAVAAGPGVDLDALKQEIKDAIESVVVRIDVQEPAGAE